MSRKNLKEEVRWVFIDSYFMATLLGSVTSFSGQKIGKNFHLYP